VTLMTPMTPMTWSAAALAALAAMLLAPPPATPLATAGRGGRGRIGTGRVTIAVLCGTGGVLLVTVQGLRLALALVVLIAVAAAAGLVHRARAARAAEQRRRHVVDVAEAFVGELRAGQPVITGLEHCVEIWRELDSVVSAARLGADVPAALRRLARLPGAEGLRDVASAWQVSERSGTGLATAMAQVAETARSQQATRHLVQGELASAQATARLVALLPVASLAMSAGIGGDPWHFLFGTAVGVACLGTGVLLAFAGLLWIDRIAAGVLRG
jgi:tight adherence protein B